MTWYYGVYYAASAMVAAQDGSFQNDPARTANAWDRHIATRGIAMPSFGMRVSTLIEGQGKTETERLRAGSVFDLKKPPSTTNDALVACCAYLSGTAEWYRRKTAEDLRALKEFKALGVSNFRTKDARELRNAHLCRKAVGFMHQAVRYRGKANYREALFLGYGNNMERLLTPYIDDLVTVLAGFVTMAGAMASRRLGKQLWDEFVLDVEVSLPEEEISPLGPCRFRLGIPLQRDR